MNNFLNPNIPSWVNPDTVKNAFAPIQQQSPTQQQTQQRQPFIPPQLTNVMDQTKQKFTNLMDKLPQPLQQFFQMLMSGNLSGLEGFKGLQSVDHDPFNGQNPFLQQQQNINQQVNLGQMQQKNTGQNINKWGTNDTGLGIYGG